ncbi:unnamed protein product, partial [Brachionus calyciflorus]
MTDITGIKWLRLRAKEVPASNENQSLSNKTRKKRKKSNDDDDEDEDDDDENITDDDNEEEVFDTDKPSSKMTSNLLKTTCTNDPILTTHSKCLNEDILCAWKRIDLPSNNNNNKNLNSSTIPDENFEETPFDEKDFKKELWIFWFEKEEPPNLRSLISNDLFVDHSNQNAHNHSNNNQSINEDNILSQASSSLISLPYECRSMLFKSLHNLIEKSLLEKGYARLGKWFVMPYNLNAINFSIGSDNINSSTVFLNQMKNKNKLKMSQIDDTNHVSYSFGFFLHGTSRVCTSVDLKLHKPLRFMTPHDLTFLKENLKNYFQSKKIGKKILKKNFFKQNVILGPYGIAARLIGYLSNETLESKLTCTEWKQFYPLNLIQDLPNVFVIGLDSNRVKLFYPNCFIYFVMDSDSDKSDDDDENFYNLNESCSESQSDYSSLNSVDSLSEDEDKSIKKIDKKPEKEMDSLDLTIDSVARNFGADKDSPPPPPPGPSNKSILSISLNSPISINAVSSPTSVQSPINSPGKLGLKRQKSLLNRSNSNQKKRKKNFDSSSSDMSLNNSATNVTQSPRNKKNEILKKKLNSELSSSSSSSSSTSSNEEDDETVLTCKNYLENSKKNLKFTNSDNVNIDDNDDEDDDELCCKYKFNLNKKLNNQIRLKHKKYDLLPENLPLAFEVLDKVNLGTCTQPLCGSFTCTRCCLIGSNSNKSTSCSCSDKNSKNSNSLSSNFNTALSSLVKTEPGLDNLNLLNTKQVAFHKRKCYFPHKKPIANNFKSFKKYVKNFKLNENCVQLRKSCQFKPTSASSGSNLLTRVLRVKNECDRNLLEIDDSDDGLTDSSSSDSVHTDPDMFNYQYFEKDDDVKSPIKTNTESSDETSDTDSDTTSSEESSTPTKTDLKITYHTRYLNNLTNKKIPQLTPDKLQRKIPESVEKSDSEDICFDNFYQQSEIFYEEEPEVNLIAKSSQMTPPKSVENQQTVHHSHNPVNIPPISYDDLNNIFEEESSTDEQQQQNHHQQQQNIPQPVQLINPIQTGLSVVMTPPSHENIQKTNQTCQDDLLITDPNYLQLNTQILPTRKIPYADLNQLLQNQNFTNLLSDEKFQIPKLITNVALNKYKPIQIEENTQTQTLSFKWKLSTEQTTMKAEIKVQKNNEEKPSDFFELPPFDTNRKEPIFKPLKLDVQIRPLDKFLNQIDPVKFKKLNLNLNKYVNSVCLNLNLSDTLLNLFRDINFDSCTLCVCTNNNIKGLDFGTYLCNDVLNVHEGSLNVNNNNLNQSMSTNTNPVHYVSCTCGFSSIVNRSLVSKQSRAIRLNKFIQIIEKLKMDSHDQNMTLPYYNLISLLNRLTQSEYQNRQLVILDSTSHNGLFSEDYNDILMLSQPHYLLWSILQENTKLTLTSSLITRKFLNSILIRDNYMWKKSLVMTTTNDNVEANRKNLKKLSQFDERLAMKLDCKLEDSVKMNILDLFDLKYSQPMLSTYEQYEIYQNNLIADRPEDIFPSKLMSQRLKKYLKQKLKLACLNEFDENNVCRNVLKRLDGKMDLKDSKFILHEWLYKKKEIKSNLEMTKSLKLIQPLLEETVQKKYTTSRMWESFQGPLTWQHFCRLASNTTQQKQSQNSNQSNQQNNTTSQQNYEPEPIPALLVSSLDKDWVTISPYALKFWDKLNLEPYSRQKNLAYLILMPDCDLLNEQDVLLEYENTKSCVREYFKELNSIYELCRLGLHRPALRIASDGGFVKVNNQQQQEVKVDEWFTKIQSCKSTRQIGKMLKSYAKTFKLLAQKITQGATSTISNTVQGSFFPSETLNNQVKNATSFQTSHSDTPVVSQINLDKFIYEELKLKDKIINPTTTTTTATPTPTVTANSSSSALSNLLNQPIGIDFSDSLNLEFSSTQAQILNFKEEENKDTVFLDAQTQQYQSQQQVLNSLASSSNLTQITQLTQNIQTPPSLIVYIIDPFDYKLFTQKDKFPTAKIKTENDTSDLDDDLEADNEEIYNEFDLKRLRQLGFFKAYLEFYNNLPDLFKFNTQFQIIPLQLCVDLQTQSTSMYIQSILLSKHYLQSNYSSYYSSGFGTNWSDMDSDFKQSLLKSQAFNSFCLSKRYFMSPAHNFYLNLHQQQAYPTRAKIFTSFGPAASEEKFLHEALLQSGHNYKNFSDLKKLQFYSPLFVLAPSTITTTAVSLAASNLFYKNQSNVNNNHHHSNHSANGTGDGISQMPNFIQLNFSNSNYGLGNSTSNLNGNFLTSQSYQQQSNVLYVGYCLSEDQRFLLTCCTDENGELIESTSINIEIDERQR